MKKEILEKLNKYNQEHLIQYFELCNEIEKINLEKQIENIDFEALKSLYETTKNKTEIEDKKITHIPYIDKSKLSQEKLLELNNIGKKVIENAKYAVVTMAGGQGTRLRTYRT